MKKQDLKQLPLSQAAFPVSPSPPPENGRALRMNATCGRKCAALLPSCGPVGCLGKMLLASSIWGSTKRSLTWQKRDTLFSHSYFRLAASAHGMSASELLSSRLMFPTPLASDNNTARDAASLDVFLSDNGIFRKRNRNGAIWSLSLSAAVFYLTPVASDGFRSTLKPSAFDPAKKDGNLSAQIISQERPVSETAALNPEFELTPGDPEAIRAAMRELMAKRKASQPLEWPSAGSTFKRPEGHFAGTLIDQCGLKGLTVGGAQVSEKHAGFLINRGGATFADMAELIRQVQQRVLEETGVTLEPEVKIVK